MIFWLFFGIVAATIAAAKGRSGFGYFCLGMLIGPFSRAVALLPPVNR